MAVILDQLPSEILDHILNSIQDQMTYHALCLTSRHLHSRVTPKLYSKLILAKKIAKPGPGAFGSSYERLLSLLRTLSIHPERAAHFKYVKHWDWTPMKVKQRKKCQKEVDLRLLHFLLVAVDRITEQVGDGGGFMNEGIKWEMREGSEDVLMTVFLSLCSNLEELDGILHGNVLCFKRLFSAGGENFGFFFKRLQKVSLSHWDKETALPLEDFRPFLQLPTLTSLTGNICSKGSDEASPFADLPSKSSNIRTLHFRRSTLSKRVLFDFMRIPCTLVNFSFDHGPNEDDEEELYSVQKLIGNQLRANCTTTLETLVISVDGLNKELTTSLGYFDSFKKLRVMDVPMSLLLHPSLTIDDIMQVSWLDGIKEGKEKVARLLPESIEELILQECNGETELYPCLWLASLKRDDGMFSALKKLNLKHPPNYSLSREQFEREKLSKPEWAELQSICGEIGVDLVVIRDG